MKKKLSVLLVLVSFFTLFAVVPALAIPTVSLSRLGGGSIAVGDSFDVVVTVDGDDIGEELLAFGFDVSINDGSVFAYDGYVIESGFDDDSFGLNNVAGSRFPGIADDDVLLATLSFTALAEGTNTLNVAGLYDGMFSGLYYEMGGYDIDASLNIGVGVPEPATMLLLGTGLVGLFGLRRKFTKEHSC